LEDNLGRKFVRRHLNQKKLDKLAHACHPSYMRKHKEEDFGQVQPGHKVRPYLKNNQGTKGWRHGPSGTTPN
jgi:hypothetical protein